MNKNVLSLGIATALVVPITTHADIKLYGQIGAEAASVEYAGGDENLTSCLLYTSPSPRDS